MLRFYIPRKQKTSSFLIFPEGMEVKLWLKMGFLASVLKLFTGIAILKNKLRFL